MNRSIRLSVILAALFILAPGVAAAAEIAPARTYAQDLYVASAVRYQDPDYKACVAASTEMMLNMVAAHPAPGDHFRWATSTSYATQEQILRWERAHHTQVDYHPGVDANGWRNGLNYFGWGTYTDPATMVYRVMSFSSYSAAVKAIVSAIARYHKPVAILGWAGGHAQFITGYVVSGQDPAVSTNFIVKYVYLTDPLRRDARRDARISDSAFRNGPTVTRFRPYIFVDSPKDDPYTLGNRASYKDWIRKWVIVAPVR